MLFFIRYQDQEHRVRVESRSNKLFVTFEDEAERPVDLKFHGNDVMFIDDNKVFQANVVGEKLNYTVWRPEGNFHVTVESEYKRIVGLLRGQSLEQENNVYAKMPGKIVKISKKVGDKVEKGESVIVMEAMKMENEIRAMVAGEVSNISVAEGQAVESGALLLEIKPSEG